MDFKKTTDELLAGISHQELAKALGVSVPTVRQARLAPGSNAHRSPPEGWERVVSRMAKERARRLERLAARFQSF